MSTNPIYITVFDIAFLQYAEYHLSKTFKNSSDPILKWFWCDGIKSPTDKHQLESMRVVKSKEIITEAWIGTTGQDVYVITIVLGPLSIENCLNNTDLKTCVPDYNSMDWITIDISAKTIKLCLL